MGRYHTCYSPYQNLLPLDKNELAGGAPKAAPTDNSNKPSHIPTVSQAPTTALALFSALTMSVARYCEKKLKRATRFALNSFI